MLKILTTQLTGYLKRYEGKEEFEDAARLLAQAAFSDGTIWLYGQNEMNAVIQEGLHGQEPCLNAKELQLQSLENVEINDRVLLFSRHENEKEALHIAKELQEKHIPVIVVTTLLGQEDNDSLSNYADITFDLGLKKAILPDENGERYLYPSSLLALYVYFGLMVGMKDILSEYE